MYLPRLKAGLAVAVVGLLLSGPAPAVIVTDTTDNTSRPPDDPGWDNVGVIRNSTGIYLGNRWVMTPAHVGAASIDFPEVGVFEHVPESVVRLRNPDEPGLSDQTDILLFQLNEDPGLPPLMISKNSPPIGAEAIVVGHGKDREDELTYWTSSWRETDPPSRFSGFKTESSNSLRWGTNLVEDDELFGRREFDDDITTVVQTTGDVIALITEYDYNEGNSDRSVTSDGEFITAYESQAVTNDSGGPLFVRNGGAWELAGMAVAVDGLNNNQPDVTRTAVFGSITYHADLATYRDQIVDRVVPGDFDDDGQLSAADIDLMTLASLADQYQARFDLNRDGSIDEFDRTIWIEDLRNSFYGDSNLDGQFNSQDLIVVFKSAEYEDGVELNSTWASGDWNGDLEFSTSDFVVALQTGAYEAGPRGELDVRSVAVIPEPGSASLLCAALLAIGCFGRRTVHVHKHHRHAD